MQKPHLISFDICPFVQRSVITLLEKDVEFDLTFIDLANKPDWFLKISPFGKVPVLKVADTVIFESAVINEYLDEVNPPSMHPSDPVKKAHNRAWIEFASSLNMDMFHWALADSQDKHDELLGKMLTNLEKVEAQLQEGPFFNGEAFNLVDAAYAPFFMRIDFLTDATGQEYLVNLPKCKTWQAAMRNRESVKNSAPKDIREKFVEYIKGKKSILAKSLAK